MPFGHDRHSQLPSHLSEQGPTEAVIVQGARSVSVQGGPHAVGAGGSGSQGFIERGDVSHDGQMQFLMNTLDNLLPRVAIGPSSVSAVERDDGGAGGSQGGGGGEIRSDAQSRTAILFLDTYNG